MLWWFAHQPSPHGISSRMYFCWETLKTRYWKADIMFVNTLEILFLWMSRALVLMPTASVDLDQPRTIIHFSCNIFLKCLHLLIRRWMTSWIQTGPLCQLFEIIYPRWHWSTKWGHHGGFFPPLWRYHKHAHSAIRGQNWCGMLIPKPTPSYWLTNGSIPWDSALARLHNLVFLKANDALC